MRYTLNREILATALRCVEPALSTIDWKGSRDFLIGLSPKGVLLAGSNGNMAVQARFAPITGEGDFSAILDRTLAIAAESRGDTVTLEERKNGHIRCRMCKEKLDLKTAPSELFPDFPTYEKRNIIATLPGEFLESLRRVSMAMPSGVQGPPGVVFAGDSRDGCRLMAANRTTAACDKLSGNIASAVELLLPDGLVKYLCALTPSAPLKLIQTDNHIVLETKINDIHVSIAHTKFGSEIPNLGSHLKKLKGRVRIRLNRKVGEWVFKRAKKISANAPAKVTLRKEQKNAVIELIHTGDDVLFARYRNTFKFESASPSDLEFTVRPQDLLTFLTAITSETWHLEVFDRVDPIKLSNGNFEFLIQVHGQSYDSPTNKNGERNPIGDEREFSLVES